MKFDESNLPFAMPRGPSFAPNTFLQLSPTDNKILFQHRIHIKFSLLPQAGFNSFQHKTDGLPKFTGNMGLTGAVSWQSTTEYNPKLFHEEFGHQCLLECDELVFPEKYFRFRKGTTDREVWDKVVLDNQYELPRDLRDTFWLDVGAHIGAFTHAVLRRGAAHVVAVEPDTFGPGFGNLCSLQRNLKLWGQDGKLTVVPRAAWSKADKIEFGIHPDDGAGHPEKAGFTSASGHYVETISFNDLVNGAHAKASKPVCVKLHVEMAEWEVLRSCTTWDKIDRITGIYHHVGDDRQENMDHILATGGFKFVNWKPLSAAHGLFWARRTK